MVKNVSIIITYILDVVMVVTLRQELSLAENSFGSDLLVLLMLLLLWLLVVNRQMCVLVLMFPFPWPPHLLRGGKESTTCHTCQDETQNY